MRHAALLLGCLVPLTAADHVPTFEDDIRPILKAHCFYCHGEDGEVKGDLDLRLVRTMRAAKAIDAAHPEKSPLLEALVSGDMPKEGKPLHANEVALIRRWLVAGAPTRLPEPEQPPHFTITEREASHWSFRPVAPVAVPDNGEAHPIDAFVRAGLSARGLDFAAPADRVTLIRRATLDLHGLPPTPEAITAFVTDDQPQAWERLIDRLLSEPAYGERWGRHWLDVVGYADSNGGPKDSVREHAWHYRDYVVRALSDDKPWNEFISEQLAGDELAGLSANDHERVIDDRSRWDRIAATGFWRMAPDGTGDDPANAAQAREEVITGTLRIMGSALLGLTVQCAQCHDHRFDPIAHSDYFRLRALIEPVYDPSNWRTPGKRLYAAYTTEEQAANAAIEDQAKAIDRERFALIDREYEKYLGERLAKIADEAVRAEVNRVWHKTPKDRSADEKKLLETHDCAFEKAGHLRFLPGRDKEEAERVQMEARAATIRASKQSRQLMAVSEVPGQVPVTRRFHRGDPRQPKEAVAPGDLQLFVGDATLPEKDPARATTGRRTAYAAWLTSGRHPLLARVLVNRFWMHHVGRGFVATPDDLGLRTPRPLQGDLLDHLAGRFVADGWRLKTFHRLVMTSRTYQQGNRNAAAEAQDADNRLLARMPLRRLEAEAVRDALLAVSGRIDRSVGGAPLIVARNPAGGIVLGKELVNQSNNVVHTVEPLGDAANRRSLYVQVRRDRQLSVLQAFDLPVMAPNCSQRVCSTVAPQALMMLNDTFVIEQSLATAARLRREHPGDDPAARTQQVTRLWQLAYGAAPHADELAAALALIDDETRRQAERVPGETKPDAKKDPIATAIASTDAPTRALAALCQVVTAANRFLYAP